MQWWKSCWGYNRKMHYRMYMTYATKPVDFEAPNRSVWLKKSFIKNFAIFTTKHLCWSVGLWACNFFEKRFQRGSFRVKIAEFEWDHLFWRTKIWSQKYGRTWNQILKIISISNHQLQGQSFTEKQYIPSR